MQLEESVQKLTKAYSKGRTHGEKAIVRNFFTMDLVELSLRNVLTLIWDSCCKPGTMVLPSQCGVETKGKAKVIGGHKRKRARLGQGSDSQAPYPLAYPTDPI
ncbi:hypothetical protein HAX54_020979 [Datura stramonium]|uniref:Uncharacterized protein n=1 Tax=Datura stramonium TaxID=4076 RepID=A0ABS8URV9_DATST|nr:hypothetical protein [Datura stramonium]